MSVERIMVNGHELTAFDLPPEPSETYTVNVDGLGEIVVEKGKPPKEKDVPAMYMRKLVPELCEQNAALFRENAKLRKLVKRMHRHIKQTCDVCDEYYCSSFDEENECCVFDVLARELGVDDGD